MDRAVEPHSREAGHLSLDAQAKTSKTYVAGNEFELSVGVSLTISSDINHDSVEGFSTPVPRYFALNRALCEKVYEPCRYCHLPEP